MELVFKLPQFEGPLDLLLHLVKKRRINVRQIPISQLADEFIEYVERMKRLDLQLASDFFVMASHLMELKSKYLLPSLSEREKRHLMKLEEDLYRRIELYEQVKQFAEHLEKDVKDLFLRKRVRVTPMPYVQQEKLLKVLKAILEEMNIRTSALRIKRSPMTVEQIMEELLERLTVEHELSVYEVLRESASRYELIVRFLAVLELIHLKKCLIATEDGKMLLRRYEGFEPQSGS
ncbi:segregation and condensation protein A [Pseudothermotoga sp.]|nr:segregation/condensation protein A [Pseudothermotoga sp.]MCX7813393.1 segregation/condensation protein A [Pseudothermotoga sp.]MDW8139619.1 segregation/condensation protein A [Pseudothermotoga sp.]